MSIVFEDSKCRLINQPDLYIKRYLSGTRAYFREGAWIREYFKEFFPAVTADEQGELYYDLNSLHPEVDLSSQASLKNSKVPQEVIDRFSAAVAQFNNRIEKGPLSFNEEISSEGFTMPDPKLHPELYIIVETKRDIRLLVLWGLESNKKNGNVSLEEVASTLQDRFVGKPSLKAVTGKPRKEYESPDDAEPEAPTPTVAIIPEEPEEQPAPVTAEAPARKSRTPVVKDKPAVKKASPQREPFDWSRLKWAIRGGVVALIVLAALMVLTEISVAFLGPKLVTTEVTSPTQLPVLKAQQGEEWVMPDGKIVAAKISDLKVLPSEFSKAGNYRFVKKQIGSTGEGETTEILYSNARNDMADLPVASLRVDRRYVHPGDVVTAGIFQSFHEDAKNSSMSYSLSWGDSDAVFESVDDPEAPLTHTFSETGDFTINLWVRDGQNHHDYDLVAIKVVAPEETLENHFPCPPVPDAEVLALQSSNKGFGLDLGIGGTHDLDGAISNIAVDWGDGNAEDFVPGTQVVRHLYAKSVNMAIVRVTAIDEDGMKSLNAAELVLDFESPQLDDKARFAKEVNLLNFRSRQIENESEGLSMEELVSEEPIKNKKRMRFTLNNPAKDPTLPLINVRWRIEGPDGLEATIADSRTIEILGVDGSYLLSVYAEAPTGEHYEIEHRFTIRINNQLSLPVKMANWFAENLSAICLSKMF